MNKKYGYKVILNRFIFVFFLFSPIFLTASSGLESENELERLLSNKIDTSANLKGLISAQGT